MTAYDLTPGQRYRVIKEFKDDHQQVHPVGETWTYHMYSFVPYHSGFVLHVFLDGQTEQTTYNFWATAEGQDHILHNFFDYVEPA